MSTFLMFGKYTQDSLKTISPDRTHKAEDVIAKFGGKIYSMYALLGDHDLVLAVELPGVEAAMQASLALNQATGICFTTSPAVKVEEFDRLVTDL